jgi:hypothetical protein
MSLIMPKIWFKEKDSFSGSLYGIDPTAFPREWKAGPEQAVY